MVDKYIPWIIGSDDDFVEGVDVDDGTAYAYVLFDTEREARGTFSTIHCDNSEFPIYAWLVDDFGNVIDKNS